LRRLVRYRKRAGLASSELHAMEDAPGDGV